MIFTLNGSLGTGDTTINVVESTASAPPAATGYVIIETEIISYTGKGTNSFTGCTRGALSTTVATHATGLLFGTYFDVVAPSIKKMEAATTTVKVIPNITIPFTTLHLHGIVAGSSWALVEPGSSTPRVSGTATDTEVLSTYENFTAFDATLNIRKKGYIPIAQHLTINSGLTDVYISQVLDPIA